MIVFQGITHVLIAVSLCTRFFNLDLLILLALVVGSLFPDIDIATSKLGRYNLFAPLMKHRGRMHTIIVLGIIAMPLSLINTNMALGFAFGYLLHLIADTFTPMGIMWLYPYNKKYYSLARKVNFSRLEPLISGLCLLAIFLRFLQVFKNIILNSVIF